MHTAWQPCAILANSVCLSKHFLLIRRQLMVIFTVFVTFCGILFLKKTDYLSMDAYRAEIQFTNPIIYQDVQNLEKNDLRQTRNSLDANVAAVHSVVQDLQSTSNISDLNPSQRQGSNSDISTTVTATTHSVTEVTQTLKSNLVTQHNSNDIDSTKPVTEDIQDIKYNQSRFVLCYSYWEQQTNALINMWSLQKWADKSGKLKVVEPFVVKSKFVFPEYVDNHQLANTLRFSDYFDLDYWTKETSKLGIEPLVSWETFLKYANRKVIVALPVYGAPPGGVYVDNEISKCEACKAELEKFTNNMNALFKNLNFEVIKIVCFAFYRAKDTLSLQKFNSHLISYSKATVWFGFWEGVASGRVLISDHSLARTYIGSEKILSMMQPSPRIIVDSRNYVKTVLNTEFRGYTAINIRSARRYAEMVLKGYPSSDVLNYFMNCAGKLNDILDKSGSTRYFLSADIGKLGDQTAYKLNDNDSEKLLQQILQVVYGNRTIDSYENEFIKAANGVEDRGYLASVQKTITEKANCLIVMGGFSKFQRSIMLNYRNGNQFKCIKYLCYEDPIRPLRGLHKHV